MNKLGKWVLELEDKYSMKGRTCWNSVQDYMQAMETRNELSCVQVGKNTLLLSGKARALVKLEIRHCG